LQNCTITEGCSAVYISFGAVSFICNGLNETGPGIPFSATRSESWSFISNDHDDYNDNGHNLNNDHSDYDNDDAMLAPTSSHGRQCNECTRRAAIPVRTCLEDVCSFPAIERQQQDCAG